jgi:Ca2+-binding EF-hand superfamily protein
MNSKKLGYALLTIALSLVALNLLSTAYAFSTYDVNKDGSVDINDIAIVAQAFGSYSGHPRWNSTADVNGDGIVDMMDIVLIAAHFGE